MAGPEKARTRLRTGQKPSNNCRNNTAQEIPQDLAVWIADVVQIQVPASETPVSDDHAKLIKESADRLLNVLKRRLTSDLQARIIAVAREMAQAIAA